MQVKDTYDLVVVGDQLSGLFLAASAAQSGYSVLVIEGNSSSTALYEVPSGRFLSDLVCEPILGLAEGNKVDQFLRSLGLYQNINHVFPEFYPTLQVISPGVRVDFDYKAQNLEKEIDREFFPLHKVQRQKVVKVLSGQYVTKGTFADAVEKNGLETHWEHWGDLQPLLYGSALPVRQPYYLYKRIVDTAAVGVRYPLGGRSALKERLLSRIKVFGGTVKRNTWVEEIIFERRRLAGVMLSSYEGFVRAKSVVGAMGLASFYSLIPKNMQPKKLSRAVEGIIPRYWRLTFSFLVPDALIPEGMGNHVCIHDFEDRLSDDGFLQIQIFDKDSYSGIKPDERAFVVRILMPFEQRSLQPEFAATMIKRSLRRINEAMPFLSEAKLKITPDPDNLEHDDVYREHYCFKSLQHIPPSFLVYEHCISDAVMNVQYMDWEQYGLKGLGICSRDVFPAFGLLGEALTAMEYLQSVRSRGEGK